MDNGHESKETDASLEELPLSVLGILRAANYGVRNCVIDNGRNGS